jgi:phosphoglycolate phosphatase
METLDMTYPYRLVVFDWEGTIVDPLGALVNFLWSEVNQQGFEAFTQNQVRHHLLNGLPSAVRSLFTGLSEQQRYALIERAERAVSQERHKIFVFSGIKSLLRLMQSLHIDLAVASNKSPQSLHHALETSELLPYFKIYRGAGVLPPKPNPQMLMEILDIFGHPVQEVVMVGDSFADIEMARNVNVDAIAIDWYASGVWNADKMGAKTVVHTIEQLAGSLGLPLAYGEKIEQDV